MSLLEFELKVLVKFFKAQKIKYIILGGIAVSIYGEPRMTADIDANVIIDKERINEFLEKAKKFNFHPLFPNAVKIAKKTGVIPLYFKKKSLTSKVDIIVAENVLEYAAIKRGRMRKIGSIGIRLVSPEDLIIHKITSTRPRDLGDIKGILVRQKGRLDTRYIRRWLKKIDKTDKNFQLCKLFNSLSRA